MSKRFWSLKANTNKGTSEKNVIFSRSRTEEIDNIWFERDQLHIVLSTIKPYYLFILLVETHPNMLLSV